MGEKPFTKIEPLVETLSESIFPLLDKPFAFFGHSMGALIAFELTHHLRNKALRLPTNLFVSGRPAPTAVKEVSHTYDLPDAEFIEELGRLNGTPKEVLENPDLMTLLSPVLRADFELVQTYEFSPVPPLPCPIRAFGGLEDREVSKADIEEWARQTSSSFSLSMLPGDHFFLHIYYSLISKIICKDLNQTINIFG